MGNQSFEETGRMANATRRIVALLPTAWRVQTGRKVSTGNGRCWAKIALLEDLWSLPGRSNAEAEQHMGIMSNKDAAWEQPWQAWNLTGGSLNGDIPSRS